MERPCIVCGKPISCHPSTIAKKKYCSASCKSKIVHAVKECICCGKQFKIFKCAENSTAIIYNVCSNKCKISAQNKQKKEIKERKRKVCQNCKKIYFASATKPKVYSFCSQKCSKVYMKGTRSPFYKGIPYKNKAGYLVKNYGDGKGQQYVHRVEAEKKIGRRLKKNEVVHHADGNRTNNCFNNLIIMDKIEHDTMHTIRRHIHVKKF